MWEWVRECADEARRQRWQGQGEQQPPQTPRAADRRRRTAHGKGGYKAVQFTDLWQRFGLVFPYVSLHRKLVSVVVVGVSRL
eukprot:scaffold5611_cov48-Phaeocystis_antarctica.AAC.6